MPYLQGLHAGFTVGNGTIPDFPEGRCAGFGPGTTLPTGAGYIFVFLAVFFFGTNFVPIKQ